MTAPELAREQNTFPARTAARVLAGDSSNDKWEQNIVPVRVHINVWAAAAIIVALFQFQAVGINPPEFYVHLRWLTLPVTVFGLYVAFRHDFSGWTLLLASIAVLFNPIVSFHFSRSTWFFLDIASGATLIASAMLLRWNTENRWVTRPRDIIDVACMIIWATIWWGVILHLVIVVVLLPISYVVSRDERLVADWRHWRDANLWLVGTGTVAVVWLTVAVLCLLHWLSSGKAIRRVLTEPRT